ncbi:ribonuclease H-like domain-containing protein [Tanacetum coccineum]
MMTYLKHVGNKKHADLKTKSFEEIKVLYEKIKRFDDSFITVDSVEDERQVKKMNKEAGDPKQKRLKKRVVKEEDTTKVPAEQEVTEQGTKKRKSGHVKMIARKSPRPQPEVNSDDEHRKCLRIVALDSTIDSEVMETKSVIASCTRFHHQMEITLLSTEQMDTSGDFWNNQQEWEIVRWRLYEACGVCIPELKDGTVIHMLVERRYPLSKELLQRMLDLGLEVEEKSTSALHLNEIGKKFKLKHETFKMKYLNEDEKWILMTSDQDLSDCIQNSRNVHRSSVRLHHFYDDSHNRDVENFEALDYEDAHLGLDSLSFDDLYNNLRVFESDVKGSSGSSSSTQNVAFVSSESTNNTNDVSTAYGVSTSSGYNSQRENSSSYTNDFDAKEPLTLDKYQSTNCFNCHKTGHFAREYRSKGNQDLRKRDAGNTGYKAKDNGRRPGKQEEPKALQLAQYTEVTSCSKELSMSAKDKFSWSSDTKDTPVNDRFANVEGMHAVPPPMTGNYMPPGPDIEIDESQFTYGPK